MDLLAKAKQFISEGVAIEPVLIKDYGEMTRVIFQGEQHMLACNSQRFVTELCQTLFLNLKSLQEVVKPKLNKKQLVPIPLSFQLVLIPLRCINQENVKTRGFLWIVHRQIQEVHSVPLLANHSSIVLKNGVQLQVPYSAHFIQQQLRDACLIEYLFLQAHMSFPHEQRPARSGQAWTPPMELQMQLLHIAEAIRKYSS